MNGIAVNGEGRDAAAVAAVLAARAASIGPAPPPADDTATVPHLAFTLDGATHALPLDDVEAVAPLPPVTAVPQAPRALAGLVAWRGEVVNLLDPAAVLGGGGDTPSRTAMVLLRRDRPRVALAVDALSGVVPLPPAPTAAIADLLDTADGHVLRHAAAALVGALLGPARYQEG